MRTVNGVVHTSYESACEALGFLDDDKLARQHQCVIILGDKPPTKTDIHNNSILWQSYNKKLGRAMLGIHSYMDRHFAH